MQEVTLASYQLYDHSLAIKERLSIADEFLLHPTQQESEKRSHFVINWLFEVLARTLKGLKAENRETRRAVYSDIGCWSLLRRFTSRSNDRRLIASPEQASQALVPPAFINLIKVIFEETISEELFATVTDCLGCLQKSPSFRPSLEAYQTLIERLVTHQVSHFSPLPKSFLTAQTGYLSTPPGHQILSLTLSPTSILLRSANAKRAFQVTLLVLFRLTGQLLPSLARLLALAVPPDVHQLVSTLLFNGIFAQVL